MQKFMLSFFAVGFLGITVIAQVKKKPLQPVKTVTDAQTVLERPKLVVGIVVDQMRWDYLYRYYNRYSSGGFKRLINEGFSCDNTLINYLPSYTAVGHTTVFTGSVPALDGITGNDWVDQLTGKRTYCTEDTSVHSAGSKPKDKDGKMSPRNLLVSTVTDELRMATNFQSRVVGVSLKDRAAILPAGHLATAAYWLDSAGANFISSTYYMPQLPDWVNKYNERKNINKLIDKEWNTLYPVDTYVNSDDDNKPYEGIYKADTTSAFPHAIKETYLKDSVSFRATPFGNTLTLDFAKEAINEYGLGNGISTDFLTINCASTDYVGHMFGPNSIEVEDTYLRLDLELASFLKTLDEKIGKGKYLVFLTADHGAAHAIGFMKQHRMPADFWYTQPLADTLNKILADKFTTQGLVRSIMNYQVNFNLSKIAAEHLDYSAVKKAAVDFLQQQPGIGYAVDQETIGNTPVPEPLKTMIANGYHFKRSGGVQIVLNAGWFEGYSKTGTTHGTWNPYDTHIPLLFCGWNIKHGKTNRETHMTDIAATVAALLHIQMPNGCIGHVIEEVSK